ncbi:MAG: signal peptidase I, partial [Candidatus Omnitrophica bacterium]|nr:signal peptidase I [Candidatus Omnitrophota bacterium]
MGKIKKKSSLREWIEAIVVALALAIFVRTFFFQIYKIPTGSMIPTLMPGDKIFVSKLSYGPVVPFFGWRLPGFTKIKRGDVVVFLPPQEENKLFFSRKHFIKRLIGLPKERLIIKNGNIYINGKIVIDPKIAKNNYVNGGFYGNEEIYLPQGKYFFLGDNSINSLDSRFWG